jgi:hypothetical protein
MNIHEMVLHVIVSRIKMNNALIECIGLRNTFRADRFAKIVPREIRRSALQDGDHYGEAVALLGLSWLRIFGLREVLLDMVNELPSRCSNLKS